MNPILAGFFDIAGELYGNGGRVQRIVAVRLFDAPRIPIKRAAERHFRLRKRQHDISRRRTTP